jgi:hypothetical protein
LPNGKRFIRGRKRYGEQRANAGLPFGGAFDASTRRPSGGEEGSKPHNDISLRHQQEGNSSLGLDTFRR